TFEESGADLAVYERIRNRRPGSFDTQTFIGGATAFVVPLKSLALLSDPLMEKLERKFGKFGDDACIMLVRNTAAGAVWNAAEPSGGMAESSDLLLEQLKETVEVGVYCEEGWVKFELDPSLTKLQDEFDREQQFWWSIVWADRKVQACIPRRLELLPIGTDEFNGRKGIISADGPVGDFSFLSIARLHLEGSGWRVLDTECRPGNVEKGEPEWVPLLRTVVAIVPRQGKSPVMLEFGPDDALHPGGIHVALSREAWEYNLTHMGRAAITALGWANPY
ncbi:MAG: hypothetical protein Q7S89_01065, partial [bacterium]|nr:hypothetical protein [bacterium]